MSSSSSLTSNTLDQEKLDLISKIRKLEFKIHKVVQDTLSGDHLSLFKGQGIEFDEVREYTIGDDIKNIDWNVTGRMNYPYIKCYQEERELSFIILLDNSASNKFGSCSITKQQMANEITAIITFSVIQNRNKIGLLSFSDQIENYLPPAKGKAHGFKIISESLFQKPSSKKTDLTKALQFISRILSKKSVILILSDFCFPQNYEKWIKILSRKHTLFALQLQDPLEIELRNLGLIDLENTETGETILVDTDSRNFKNSYKSFWQQHQQKLKKIFYQYQVKFITLSTQNDYFQPLSQFFRTNNKK